MKDGSDISQSTVSSKAPKTGKTVTFSESTIGVIIVVIVVGLLSFWGGIVYQRHHTHTATALTSRSGGFLGGGRFGGSGFGSVTAISSSSITVMNDRTGTTKSYAITSSTKITDNGASATTTSITTGETVIVIPSTSDSSDAANIIVNPSFGGGFRQQTQSNTSSTTGL